MCPLDNWAGQRADRIFHHLLIESYLSTYLYINLFYIYLDVYLGSWDSAVTGSRQSGSALACASICQHAEAQASLCNAFRWDEDTGTCHIAKVTSWHPGIVNNVHPSPCVAS